MKTINYLILLLALVIQLQACKKDMPVGGDATINWGYVKEFYTQKPIAQAMVVVYGKNPMWAVQDTLYTDSNGRYEFDKVKYLPELLTSATGYLPASMQPYAPGDFFDKYNRTIYLYQPAEMMLHVKNVNPLNESDQIRINDFNPPLALLGKNVDTIICCLFSRRYETVRLQTIITRNRNGEYKDSIAIYSPTPTKATGNLVEIKY
jgi:hypothetical protein